MKPKQKSRKVKTIQKKPRAKPQNANDQPINRKPNKGDKTQTVRQKAREETTSPQPHHMKGSSLDTANHRTA
jgi:hypothetical protein